MAQTNAARQRAYRERVAEKTQKTQELVASLFRIISRLLNEPGYAISDEEAALLNEVARRV